MLKFCVLLATLLLPNLVLAETFIIPDLSRNKREVHSSAAAAGWSTRKAVGFNYLKESDETDTDDVKTEESETTTILPFIFYRTEFGLTAELSYIDESSEEEGFNPASAKDKEESKNMDLSLGYQLPQLPMTIGFGYETDNIEEKDGSTGDVDKTDTNSYSASFSYKLNEEFFVGAGVE